MAADGIILISMPDFEAIASGAGWSYQRLSDLDGPARCWGVLSKPKAQL